MSSAISIIIAALALLVSALSFFAGVYFPLWERNLRRKKLLDAAYYHVSLTRKYLKGLEKEIQSLPDKIRADPAYTPVFVVPQDDNLAYNEIIELMRWLDKGREQEETILLYFHAQAALHEAAMSFDKEVIRNLPEKRKIRLVEECVKYCGETLKHAEIAEGFLDELRARKMAERLAPAGFRRKHPGL